jgi:hypothetical protein
VRIRSDADASKAWRVGARGGGAVIVLLRLAAQAPPERGAARASLLLRSKRGAFPLLGCCFPHGFACFPLLGCCLILTHFRASRCFPHTSRCFPQDSFYPFYHPQPFRFRVCRVQFDCQNPVHQPLFEVAIHSANWHIKMVG